MLEELFKLHKDWLNFVRINTTDSMYQEDIVQEMYLKVNRTKHPEKFLEDNGQVNIRYTLQTLKRLCIDFHRAKARVVKEDFEKHAHHLEIPINGNGLESLYEINKVHHEVREKLRKEDSYWERLYMIKTCVDKPTYRELSRQTGIASSTLCKDFKKIEQIIKQG